MATKRYHTRQQKVILDFLKEKSDSFLSVEDFMIYFHNHGLKVGTTTVYRALDRLEADGLVLKVPSVDGSPALYRYQDLGSNKNYGKLICLECGKTILLQCGCIDHFSEHIKEEHDFTIDQSKTILYGYCNSCINVL